MVQQVSHVLGDGILDEHVLRHLKQSQVAWEGFLPFLNLGGLVATKHTAGTPGNPFFVGLPCANTASSDKLRVMSSLNLTHSEANSRYAKVANALLKGRGKAFH